MKEIYKPSDDSLFLARFFKKYIRRISKEISYLDMGTGSGILAETALNSGINKDNILCADINQLSVRFARNGGFNCINSDLFSKIKGKFDLITFNAPYLPKHKYDQQSDTTGGKRGDEVSIKFIKQARKHLSDNGMAFLLISSLTPFEKIKKLGVKIVARKKLFFEELIILEVR